MPQATQLTVRQQLEKYKGAYNRLRTNVRDNAQRMGRITLISTAGIGGGALAGVMRAKLPNVPGTEIPLDAAMGGLLCAGSSLDLLGDVSEYAAAFGSGLIAARLCTVVEDALK